MDLFEYQGKELYKKFNIATPKSMVIDNLEDVSTAIETLNFPLVVKHKYKSVVVGKLAE